MGSYTLPSAKLVTRLRDTIKGLEQGTGISPDDPVLLELKRVLLLKLAKIDSEDGVAADADCSSGRKAPLK